MNLKSLLLAAGLALATLGASAQDKVVYHFDNAATQGLKGLRNIRNQLDTEPTTQIIAVAHAEGIDLLMEDAKSPNGTEYAPLISALRARGVLFEVCEITLKNRGLKKDAFIQEADFTLSGVVRITKLQAQGYSYLKP
ncbi:DsrE family protein [Leptospira sp. 96542]|nr:DsrE family protein [Leptospira sp. 96542]